MGAIIGVVMLNAFAVGEEAGFPPEVLVMEKYMDGEMKTVFQAERRSGYPMLAMASAMSMDDTPIGRAEARLRELIE